MMYFNPRFPRGKRPAGAGPFVPYAYFNPRFPRGKRLNVFIFKLNFDNFNPRFPRGKRRNYKFLYSQHTEISIHASREGSD